MASAVPDLTDSEHFALSGSLGTFEGGNQAMAFGARARVTRNVSVGGGVAVGFDQGTVGGTVNARVGW
jgi:YadA-like membrane anchor domain